MKKLIIAVVLIAACHSASPVTTPGGGPGLRGNQTGAPDGESAIRAFMAASKQQDLQAMAALFGDTNGPSRDRVNRTDLDKRELIMMCYLKNDRYAIVGEAPNPGGIRAYAVSLSLGDLTRSTTFEVVQGPSLRWYVKSFDIQKLQDLCARRG